MKHFLSALILLVSIVGAAATLPSTAQAQAQAQVQAQQVVQLKPVMIIRFNQANVDYAQQLSMVVKRALSIKPEVMFDVIQYVPDTNSRSRLADYTQHKNELQQALLVNGVQNNNIRFIQNITNDVTAEELYIFVR